MYTRLKLIKLYDMQNHECKSREPFLFITNTTTFHKENIKKI